MCITNGTKPVEVILGRFSKLTSVLCLVQEILSTIRVRAKEFTFNTTLVQGQNTEKSDAEKKGIEVQDKAKFCIKIWMRAGGFERIVGQSWEVAVNVQLRPEDLQRSH